MRRQGSRDNTYRGFLDRLATEIHEALDSNDPWVGSTELPTGNDESSCDEI